MSGGSQPKLNSPEETHGTPETCALMAYPGNQAAWTRKVIQTHSPPGTVCSQSTWSPELLRPGKCTKLSLTESVPLRNTQESEWLRLGKWMNCRVYFGQCPCRALWNLGSIDPGSACHHELGQTHICQQYLFVVSLPLNTTEQVSLNK